MVVLSVLLQNIFSVGLIYDFIFDHSGRIVDNEIKRKNRGIKVRRLTFGRDCPVRDKIPVTR